MMTSYCYGVEMDISEHFFIGNCGDFYRLALFYGHDLKTRDLVRQLLRFEKYTVVDFKLKYVIGGKEYLYKLQFDNDNGVDYYTRIKDIDDIVNLIGDDFDANLYDFYVVFTKGD